MESRRSSFPTSVGLGEGLVTLGAIVVLVSIFLKWLDFSNSVGGQHITQHVKANGVPVQFLWNYTTGSTDPSLLVALIPVVVVCLLGIVLRQVQWLTFVGGALAVVVGLMYIFQLHQKLRADRAILAGFGLSDFLGIAPIICIVGGVVALIGGVVLAIRGPAAP